MNFICIHCKSKIDAKFKACPHCGEPITDFLRRWADEPIDGKYQLLARLAIGGMGEVYKALHIHLNAFRVIKVLRTDGAVDRTVAHERFQREARLATKINHPAVSTLYDFATLEDGSHYTVWEFIEGVNLHELIVAGGPLAPRYAAELMLQTLEGLDAIHRAGIVHRDISPENLMITRAEDGTERVKIIDLGIARSTVADETHTQPGGFVGKWKYCSPEHLGVLGTGERIDARADLYSLGVVFFEMLAGVPPFRANSPHEYVILHSSQDPPSLHEVNPSVAPVPRLEALIRRALAKNREQRFGSAREFASAIEMLLPALPDGPGATGVAITPAEVTLEATESDPPIPEIQASGISHEVAAERPHRYSIKRIAAMAAAAVLLAAMIVAGTLFLRLPDPPSAPPPVRRRAVAVASASTGHVGINAYPWGEVARIRNVRDGRLIRGQNAVTPTSVELPAGAWEITLTNPSFHEPLALEVLVAAGSEQVVNARFLDPGQAALPDFGGAP